MDEELPPPFPGDFEHEHSNSLGDYDENECFRHIPLPEIDTGLPVPGGTFKLFSPTPLLNGILSKSPSPSPVHVSIEVKFDDQPIQMVNGSVSSPVVNGSIEERSEDNKSGAQEIENIAVIVEKDGTMPTVANGNTLAQTNTPIDDFDDDEFGDFAETINSAQQPSMKAVETSTVTENDEDEWGDFDSTPRRDSRLTSTASVDDGYDGFGAFGTASSIPDDQVDEESESWTPQFVESPRDDDNETWEIKLLKEIEEAEWENESQEDSTFHEDDIQELAPIMNAPVSVSDQAVLRKSFELWCLIRVVEEAKSLQYIFEGSTLASNHYKKINIDKKDPNKGKLPSISTNDILIPTPLNGGGIKPQVAECNTKELTPPASTMVSFDSLSAPPAEFDWDKSGLTNPLKGNKGSSALLDVDFLSANTTGPTSGAFTLQKDLAAFGLDFSESVEKKTSEKSIFDTIISSTTSSTTYRPVSELSLDARALHDQLPDLSCLLSTKIMLPFGGKNL